MPVNNVAELADKFTRNEIATSNEIRQFIGLKPSKDPRADELRNANISEAKDAVNYDINGDPVMDNTMEAEDIDAELADLDEADAELDAMDEMMQSGMEIKGRQKVTLTEEGRAIAKNVKENMNAEKKSKIQASNENTKAINDSNAKHLKNKVASLNKFLQQLSKPEREAQKERIHNMISSLRARNKEARKNLMEKKKNTNESIRADYKQRYATELEKIKQEHGKVGGKKGSKTINRYLKRNWKS